MLGASDEELLRQLEQDAKERGEPWDAKAEREKLKLLNELRLRGPR